MSDKIDKSHDDEFDHQTFTRKQEEAHQTEVSRSARMRIVQAIQGFEAPFFPVDRTRKRRKKEIGEPPKKKKLRRRDRGLFGR